MTPIQALRSAAAQPLTGLLQVDVRHAPWRDLITARLLVWRPHRRSPWLGEPPGHPRRMRPVRGEVDLTPGAWGVLADVGLAEAVAWEDAADRPHRAEGLRLIAQGLASIGDEPAHRLDASATRLASNARICAAFRPVCDGSPGGIPDDDPAVGRWHRRPHTQDGVAP